MKKSKKYKIPETLDYTGISRIFNRVASKYCTEIAGKTEAECSEKLSGCGLNDDCSIREEVCVNSTESSKGYECGTYRNKY